MPAESRPNLLLIMCDQLRADFLSCYGGFVDTPNVDRLARSGVMFTTAISEHPLCVPARVSLMTGLHALKTGVLENGQFLRPDYRECGLATWPELLADQGYYTAGIGKMHFYPWDLRLGFGYRRIAEDKRWIHIRDDYYHYLRAAGLRKYHGDEHEGYHEHKGAIVNRLPWEYQPDHFVGLEACRFIHEHGGDGPFAMMVGFPGPHCPYDPAPEYLLGMDPEGMGEPIPDTGDTPGLLEACIRGNLGSWNGVDYSEFTREQKLRIRAHYGGLVKQIDHEVGEILAALEAEGLLENTAIVFTSDHGDYLGDHGLIGKGSFFESSCGIPLLVRLPAGSASGGTAGSASGTGSEREIAYVEDLVTLTDVTATLLRLAGVEVPGYMDSRPLPGLGIAGASGREWVVGALSDAWMIQAGQWRLAKYETGEALLFDLKADPFEQRNLIADPAHRSIYRDLDARLTGEVMRAVSESHDTQRVYTRSLSGTPAFGREGWQRPYPRRIGE